jgi:hypothetical protein
MFNKRNFVMGVGFALTAALASSSAFAKAPDLWWDHVEFAGGDRAACVAKAESVMAAKVKEKAKKGEDNVTARTEETVAVIECLPVDGKTITMIVVSSSNLDAGNNLFEALKKGMVE